MNDLNPVVLYFKKRAELTKRQRIQRKVSCTSSILNVVFSSEIDSPAFRVFHSLTRVYTFRYFVNSDDESEISSELRPREFINRRIFFLHVEYPIFSNRKSSTRVVLTNSAHTKRTAERLSGWFVHVSTGWSVCG